MTKSVVFLKDKDRADDDKLSFDSFFPDFQIVVNVLRNEDRYIIYNIQLYAEADSSYSSYHAVLILGRKILSK